MSIRFYYDVACPYAYLASSQIEALATRHGTTVAWVPILLGGLFKHVNGPQIPMAVMSPPRAKMNMTDLHRWAADWKVPLTVPEGHPRRTVKAMRLLAGCPKAVRPALTHDLYAAYWVRGENITLREVLAPIAARHGLDIALIDDPKVKGDLFANTAFCHLTGAFGVPTVGVNDRIFWGQDRLHFVEAALGGTAKAPEWPQREGDAEIEFFHDFSSPFSYLAATQIHRLAKAAGARLTLRPILLGALFKTVGTVNVPFLAMNDAKQTYISQDLRDWAQWWGVPFQFPTAFPLRTVLPLRVALVDPQTMDCLYKAAWGEGRNIGDPQECAAVLNAAGFDGPALIAQTQAPDIKQTLRDNTARAEVLGACGVPTLVVRRGAQETLFWGQDRLNQVFAAATGDAE